MKYKISENIVYCDEYQNLTIYNSKGDRQTLETTEIERILIELIIELQELAS